MPAEQVQFFCDTVWVAEGKRHSVRQIADEVDRVIRAARSFVVMDVFLFNLHHASEPDLVPTTRQLADAFAESAAAGYFITDPFNISYGTEHNEPFDWLREGGTRICLTDLRRLRDPNPIYSPFWRLFLQWFGTGRNGLLDNPLREGETTTLRAFLEAFTLKANHRKVVVADTGAEEDYVTLVTSSNFEDASSYFSNVAMEIRDAAVARHFLDAEKAVARMSGCEVPVGIPDALAEGQARGEAEITPLMGSQIKRSLLHDLREVGPDDELYVFMLFLSNREIVRALKQVDRRGAKVTLVLDPNRVSFGQDKSGLPNQYVAVELARETDVELRWANVEHQEFHAKMVLIEKGSHCILHVGSANLDRLSLSSTNLEANVRACLPADAPASCEALDFARRVSRQPFSRCGDGRGRSRIKYWWYRLQEATGVTTF